VDADEKPHPNAYRINVARKITASTAKVVKSMTTALSEAHGPDNAWRAGHRLVDAGGQRGP